MNITQARRGSRGGAALYTAGNAPASVQSASWARNPAEGAKGNDELDLFEATQFAQERIAMHVAEHGYRQSASSVE